ncbi:hypothetical protein C8R46DRAFT_1227991 [Mycena filopes]|nr:hypothetical protein C8R46DRAFT_1227991 [Mycena filopes]
MQIPDGSPPLRLCRRSQTDLPLSDFPVIFSESEAPTAFTSALLPQVSQPPLPTSVSSSFTSEPHLWLDPLTSFRKPTTQSSIRAADRAYASLAPGTRASATPPSRGVAAYLMPNSGSSLQLEMNEPRRRADLTTCPPCPCGRSMEDNAEDDAAPTKAEQQRTQAFNAATRPTGGGRAQAHQPVYGVKKSKRADVSISSEMVNAASPPPFSKAPPTPTPASRNSRGPCITSIGYFCFYPLPWDEHPYHSLLPGPAGTIYKMSSKLSETVPAVASSAQNLRPLDSTLPERLSLCDGLTHSSRFTTPPRCTMLSSPHLRAVNRSPSSPDSDPSLSKLPRAMYHVHRMLLFLHPLFWDEHPYHSLLPGPAGTIYKTSSKLSETMYYAFLSAPSSSESLSELPRLRPQPLETPAGHVRLTEAHFIRTEPHSKRLRVSVTIQYQKEVRVLLFLSYTLTNRDDPHAIKMVEFLSSIVPVCSSKSSEQMLSSDTHTGTANFKFTTTGLHPAKAAALYEQHHPARRLRPPRQLPAAESADISSAAYWFNSLTTVSDLVEFTVLDVESAGCARGKYVLIYHTRTHLGAILQPGDTALGYHITNANCEDYAALHADCLPDIVLVNKAYPNRRKKSKRGTGGCGASGRRRVRRARRAARAALWAGWAGATRRRWRKRDVSPGAGGEPGHARGGQYVQGAGGGRPDSTARGRRQGKGERAQGAVYVIEDAPPERVVVAEAEEDEEEEEADFPDIQLDELLENFDDPGQGTYCQCGSPSSTNSLRSSWVERQLIGVVTSRDGIGASAFFDDEHALLTITILKGFSLISSPPTTTTPTIAERPTLPGSLFTTTSPRLLGVRRSPSSFNKATLLSTINPLALIVFLALAALLALVVVVAQTPPTDPLRRPPRLRRFVGRLKQNARRCVIRVKQAAGRAPTLHALYVPPRHSSRALTFLKISGSRGRKAQIAAHIQHRDLYALEGPGLVYLCAAVDNDVLADFDAGMITPAEFFATLYVKIGYTEDLIERQKYYKQRCDKGQTHLWLWCFRVERRCVGERVCHLSCDGKAQRTKLECRGCRVMHRDYCEVWRLGSFSWIMETMQEAFAKLGEPDLVP